MGRNAKPKTKADRIKAEKKRLESIYQDIDPVRQKLAAPLIERAAFMRIECEDLEADIKENGWTEMFTQSANVEPYARARPQGQSYQSLNGNYQKIIRQLDSMLPAVAGSSEDDGFGNFVTGRDDP